MTQDNLKKRKLQNLIVVEDEHLVAEGIASAIRDQGYDVLGLFSTGEKAIEFSKKSPPDLAVMDIRMPGMNGLETAEILFRELGIPVVIVSAYSDPEYTTNSANVGVFGYLLKPVTRDSLRATLAVAWGQYCSHLESIGEIDRLNQRIEDRKQIEKAKWILVDRLGISEDQAMRKLQKQARDNRKKLLEVATGILENQELFSTGD